MAPIALFSYNRPAHTRRTLESLAANPAAKDSVLYAFSDGPRAGDETSVAAVRAVLRERAWCGEVRMVESEVNRGLARNIVDGVTSVLREHESVIVLEDDLELSPGFLAFMNDALALYASESRVMSVAGYLPQMGIPLPETFFLRTTTSWGWATWRRAWERFNPDAAALAREIAPRVREFNVEGGYDYFHQLKLNAEGRLKTWAVLWYASIFLSDGINLHPGKSLVRNIGHDASGTHSLPDERFEFRETAAGIRVQRIPLEPNSAARRAFARQLRGPLKLRMAEAARRWVKRARRFVRRVLNLPRVKAVQ